MTGKTSNAPAHASQNPFNVKIILQDGYTQEGYSFGFRRSIAGEVVFNTAMSGYPESLTDPSYQGQILVLTYPLIGNYGVPPMVYENSLLRYYESERMHISGLIISEYSLEPSHWNAWSKLSSWLIEQRVPGIGGIDTRALTKHLRELGSMPGKIVFANQDIDFIDPNQENLVAEVSTKELITYGTGRYRIVLVDCGVKYNIIRKLLERDTTIIRVPWDYDFSNLEYDGLFISNGPGDPKKCTPTIKNLARAYESDTPIFGICLGNQLMALAAGGDTFKLKYGHRSHNQPVIQKGTNRCFITSQNHGYASRCESLDKGWEELFVNINDNTNEGIRHKTKPFFSTQFHPEASSGPTDTDFLFDDFIDLVKKFKK
ncbi:MAG TPA: glutamine-hydrolyzing carbamoyl-phosphate synthase small subunit [Bacteroidales bacterium]|nr:glutamine-hydrolyzing carbamoyl-phosphate synthase small subunit [Bacteroidales bacterium]